MLQFDSIISHVSCVIVLVIVVTTSHFTGVTKAELHTRTAARSMELLIGQANMPGGHFHRKTAVNISNREPKIQMHPRNSERNSASVARVDV